MTTMEQENRWKSWPRRLSVRLTAAFTLLLVVAVAAFSYYTYQDQVQNTAAEMKLQAAVLADNLAATGADQILERDYTSIEHMLLRSIRFAGVLQIQVCDVNGRRLGDVVRESGGKPHVYYGRPAMKLPAVKARSVRFTDKHMIIWQPVVLGDLIGWVKLTYGLEEISMTEAGILRSSVKAALAIMVVTVLLLMWLLHKPLASIRRYTTFADRLNEAEGEQTPVRADALELERLGNALNRASTRLHDQGTAIKKVMRDLERLASFPENNPDVVISVSPGGDAGYLNPYGREMLKAFGLERDDIHALLPHDFKKMINRCLEDGVTIRNVESSCAGHALLWTFAPVSGASAVHCYAHDITEKKNAEQLAQSALIDKQAAEAANRAKSAFLANMSHEIRTPLTAIIGFSESMLETGQSTDERVEAIKTVIRAGRHLQCIINDILDLSKIEAEKLDVEGIPVPLFPLVADVARLAGLQAQEKGILFQVEYEFPLPAEIISDPVRLKQILINLVSNGIKFTERGSVTLKVGYIAAKNLMRFEILDTGIGMTGDQQQRLFNAFAQADSSTTRRFGGTGLGLYLSKSLAQMLGGGISVESTSGQGSRFTVTVSTGPVDGRELVNNEAGIPMAESGDGTTSLPALAGRVLLAEDNPDNQRLISLYIHRLGVSVKVVFNGQEAVDAALGAHYDLVLMDMQMPVMDGLAAMRALRQQEYKGVVVALTANAMQADVDACMSAGADAFLSKPIDRAKFNSTLARFLPAAQRGAPTTVPLVSTLLAEEPELADLVEQFIEKLPDIVNDIANAARENSWKELKALVHDLKSVGGSCGFMPLSHVAAKIDFDLIKGVYDDIETWIAELYELQERILRGAASEPAIGAVAR